MRACNCGGDHAWSKSINDNHSTDNVMIVHGRGAWNMIKRGSSKSRLEVPSTPDVIMDVIATLHTKAVEFKSVLMQHND